MIQNPDFMAPSGKSNILFQDDNSRLVADGQGIYTLAPQAEVDASIGLSDDALNRALSDGELSPDEVEGKPVYAVLSLLALMALL